MKEVIELKAIGANELNEMRNQLSDFVLSNFDLLYEGAVRLNLNIEEDYYAAKRISIDSENRKSKDGYQTRLHASQGLKYANGHKYNSDYNIEEKDLKTAIKDIQMLIDEAAKEIKSTFSLNIVEL